VDRPQAPPLLPRLRLSRGLDLLAAAVVLFVLYRLLVQPRLFAAPSAPAVPFVLPALDRPEFHFPAHPGRVVFLDFWASWCEPCKASLPLVEHYARGHPDVEVIPVDSNEPAAAGARFARENGLRAVVLDTHGRVTGAYGVDGLPTMIVIDPRGFIRARWPGFNPAIELAMENARTSFSAKPAAATSR
jgi:thiol-disulfide isomerase/thioredoxin